MQLDKISQVNRKILKTFRISQSWGDTAFNRILIFILYQFLRKRDGCSVIEFALLKILREKEIHDDLNIFSNEQNPTSL